jgi:hypothetical protein
VTGPSYGVPRHADPLHEIDETGVVASIWTSCDLIGSMFPPLSRERNLTVVVCETVNGPV